MRIKVDSVKTGKSFNPRAHVDQRQVTLLSRSMNSELGQVAPIIIRRGDNELIDGLHRLNAAKRSKRKYIEAVPIDADDKQARRMSLAANSLTQPLHWMEIGRVVAPIIEEIKRHQGREKMETELAKELGINSQTLRVGMIAWRKLAPEAWDIALELSKKHLLNRNRHLQPIWGLSHDNQIALLKRVAKIQDLIAMRTVVEGFLATRRPERNTLGRPRDSSKTVANAELGKSTAPIAPAAQEGNEKESSHDDKQQRTKQKLEEALAMDLVDLSTLKIWELAKTVQPELRKITGMHCERFKVQTALKADLELLLEQKPKKVEAAPLKVST